jgi:hypothetical protein
MINCSVDFTPKERLLEFDFNAGSGKYTKFCDFTQTFTNLLKIYDEILNNLLKFLYKKSRLNQQIKL